MLMICKNTIKIQYYTHYNQFQIITFMEFLGEIY